MSREQYFCTIMALAILQRCACRSGRPLWCFVFRWHLMNMYMLHPFVLDRRSPV